jgi:uncharacterized protein
MRRGGAASEAVQVSRRRLPHQWFSAAAPLGRVDVTTGYPYKRVMQFEWDLVKAASNLAKHSVPFEAVTAVFDDPGVLIVETIRERDGEARYKAIGLIGDRLYKVVHTVRGEVRRPISARPSNKSEERSYGSNR